MYALLTHFNTKYTFGKNTKIIMNDGLAPFYMNQKWYEIKTKCCLMWHVLDIANEVIICSTHLLWIVCWLSSALLQPC